MSNDCTNRQSAGFEKNGKVYKGILSVVIRLVRVTVTAVDAKVRPVYGSLKRNPYDRSIANETT